MSREPILGRLDRDLACAIALGFVEYPLLTVTPEAVTLRDERQRDVGTERNWLDGDDPLDVATREFLNSRRKAMLAGPKLGGGGWSASSAIKDREKANQLAIQAKDRGRQLLETRGTLHTARQSGLRIIE